MKRFILLAACAARPSLTMTAETSGWLRTGRYEEAVRLCEDFARTYDGVTCREIGKSGEGRSLVALDIHRATKGAPTILIEAGIHAGEIEGKDAGFWLLRDALDGKVAKGALDAVNVVFLPIVNPDGHERVSSNNRPNQRGPEEMGFRTTGARQNMNRDWVKADTPEVQAVIGELVRDDAVLFIDLHTTDGAKFEQDISVTVSPRAPRGDGLDGVAGELDNAVVARLTALGNLPVGFYPSFVSDDDPQSGFAINEAPPRFSVVYAGVRDRIGMLVETHSWRTYKERALSTYHTLQAVLELATTDARGWREVEAKVGSIAGRKIALAWKTTTHQHAIAFRGYAYDKKHSDVSGGDWIVYDEHAPQVWNVPLYDELVPAIELTAPRGGYIVDGGFAPAIAAVLDRHHLQYRAIEPSRVDVETFRATKVTYDKPFEGRTRTAVEGAWKRETRMLDHGAIFVPIDQPAARLVMNLLEPQLPDSLVAWGELNAAFEQKEYIESYVAEQLARDMLAKDASLQGQFDAALAADPELAKSPGKRLDWFYRRSPLWDERVDLVPIYRTDSVMGSRYPR